MRSSRVSLRSPLQEHIRNPRHQAGDPHRWLFSLPSNPTKRPSQCHHDANHTARSTAARFLKTILSPPARHRCLTLGTRQTELDVPHESRFPFTIRVNSTAPSRTTYHSPLGLRPALAVGRRRIISSQIHLSSRGNEL